ncbi:hypothetical protein [Mesorhizobium sp. L103C131B0]|uniref:hypothetical protein n=1 Tax=Mesorhizobium sp. L103C131B0 TaxID=1287089 RepID=UPI0012DC2451|nr:hypothetical protein [Mesorhizobium sp. L103C131B0]
MSHVAVRAPAEDLPCYPRNPQRFGFVRELLMRWSSRADRPSSDQPFVQESFMNQHVNRRHLVTTTAALAASAASIGGGSVAVAAPMVEGLSVPEQLHQLAVQFKDAATAVDSTVSGAWFGKTVAVYDGDQNVLNAVYLERSHDVFAKAPPPVPSEVATFEATFHAEWRKLQEMEPVLSAAERRYNEQSAKLERPVMPEKTEAEIAAFRQMTLAEISAMPLDSTAHREHEKAMAAYKKADASISRKSGFRKIERAYLHQLDLTCDAATRLLRCPAQTFGDLAAKARVHQVWGYANSEDIEYVMADISRIAGKALNRV